MQGSHSGSSSGFHISTGNNSAMLVQAALQFQKHPYLESPIELLSASIRVDWFSLPVQCFLDRMPQLRQGLIRGVFMAKASSPWGGTKSERLQVSMCLPNDRDLDTWYEAVYALPMAWPDVTDIGATISRRPLPISSLPFAPSWGCLICGERSHPHGTYSAITSGIVAPII